jgi:hypothetical protein
MIRQISEDLLRHAEAHDFTSTPTDSILSLPDNLFNLICFNADNLLGREPADRNVVLDQCFRLLAPGGFCVFPIADGVRKGKIFPAGFQLVHLFLTREFKIATLIDEHKSHELPFRLSPHQYLAVFQKPANHKNRPGRVRSARFGQLSFH